LRDALSLLDQLSAFAGGHIDMAVARAALSLPSIEAVQGVIDGMSNRDPSAVMALLSDAAEGGTDLRLFAEELVVHLRALLLLRSGADARLTNELPEGEVAWLRERAPAWSAGTLMRLVQTLSEALARTRDAAQFQVQTEVALLTACDVEATAAAQIRRAPPTQVAPPLPAIAATPPRADTPATEVAAVAPIASPPTLAAVTEIPAVAGQPEATTPAASALQLRWPDVVEHVKNRNSLFGATLGSAHPVGLTENVVTVSFATEFNRKSAEKSTNRQLIETAFERVFGTAYRLRCTVSSGTEAGVGGLLDDPVINYATRTFGGQPKRVSTD
jgi:DNA polymerase-3 subunit gamma/tau